MIYAPWLALLYGVSEVAISTFLRSKSDSSATDKGSLRMIWRVIGVSMASAIAASYFIPAAFFGNSVVYGIGLALFVLGLACRWYAIVYLGKFFTVDVTVASDQTVIDTGPYKFIRHPSYTGSLLAFLGLALCFANAVTLFLMVVPITAVFLYRIRVEESALQSQLGEPYRQYMQRTRRLIPIIY
jgi:protein-S-isoprenylcysteine O-methyltransferase